MPVRLWSRIVANFVIPQTSQLAVKGRKVAVVGLTWLLTQSTHLLEDPNAAVSLVEVKTSWTKWKTQAG